MEVSVIQTIHRCPKCLQELLPEDYICESCGLCQYCCGCSSETSPDSTLPGD